MSSTLPLTGLAAESIRKAMARPDDQFTEACPFNGTADFVFTDADQDGLPGPGDSIRVTYRKCLVSQFQQTGSGTFVINLHQPDEPSTAEDKFYSGTMDARSLLPEIRSVFAFDLHFGLLEEMHRASGDITFRLDIDGDIYTESLVNLDVVKRADFQAARNEISAAGTVNSQILNGSLAFDVTKSLSGYLNTYPEQGRMELLGAAGSRIAIMPYNAPNSTLATIAVDDTGDGTFENLPDQPFWSSLVPDFTWSYMPTMDQYIRPFDENEFWFIGGSSVRGERIAVNSSLRLQFSRELEAGTVPGTIRIMRELDEPPYLEEYEVEADTRGAAIVLRPLQQFRHDSRYTYPMQGFSVADQAGNSAYVCCGGFSTTDNLAAQAAAVPTFGVSGTTIALDGSLSVSRGSPITSWAWTQLTGPQASITGAGQSTASFTIPALTGATILKIELQIADGSGELEWDTAEVHAFGSVADIGLLHFYGEDEEYVSLGREWLMSSASQAMVVERDFYNGIHVGFQGWNLYFVAPGDMTIEPGAYENAVNYQTIGNEYPEVSLSGDGRACIPSTGRFDVLEVEYGPGGEIIRAAIDFEQVCDDSKSLKGYLRIGSDSPIPPTSGI